MTGSCEGCVKDIKTGLASDQSRRSSAYGITTTTDHSALLRILYWVVDYSAIVPLLLALLEPVQSTTIITVQTPEASLRGRGERKGAQEDRTYSQRTQLEAQHQGPPRHARLAHVVLDLRGRTRRPASVSSIKWDEHGAGSRRASRERSRRVAGAQ